MTFRAVAGGRAVEFGPLFADEAAIFWNRGADQSLMADLPKMALNSIKKRMKKSKKEAV